MLFMFKYHFRNTPSVLDNLFERNTCVHNIATRQKRKFHVPLKKSNVSAKNIRYTGVKWYNYFIDILDWDISYMTFKKRIKIFLLENDVSLL